MRAAAIVEARRRTQDRHRSKPAARWAIAGLLALALIVAMALDTRVVKVGSPADIHPGAFSAAEFGAAHFPQVQASVESRAVDAVAFAAALAKDEAAAGKQYGVEASVGPEIAVKLTGVAGDPQSGNYAVKVEGVPDTVVIRVQTGPAINGMDLRDATGTIQFSHFVNQIDYQNAGSALNKEMKKQVLAKIDTKALAGKTIYVVGSFKLTSPTNWLVTPVKLEVR